MPSCALPKYGYSIWNPRVGFVGWNFVGIGVSGKLMDGGWKLSH